MNIKSLKIFLCAALLAIGCGAAVYAQDDPEGQKQENAQPPDRPSDMRGRGSMRQGDGDRMDRFAKDLGLSDEQSKKMKSMRDARAEKMKKIDEAVREKRKAVMNELKKTGYSAEKARSLQAEAKKLEADLADSRFEGLLEVRAILTDKQFEKLIKTLPNDGPGGRGGPGMKGRRGGEGGPRHAPPPQRGDDDGEMSAPPGGNGDSGHAAPPSDNGEDSNDRG